MISATSQNSKAGTTNYSYCQEMISGTHSRNKRRERVEIKDNDGWSSRRAVRRNGLKNAAISSILRGSTKSKRHVHIISQWSIRLFSWVYIRTIRSYWIGKKWHMTGTTYFKYGTRKASWYTSINFVNEWYSGASLSIISSLRLKPPMIIMNSFIS